MKGEKNMRIDIIHTAHGSYLVKQGLTAKEIGEGTPIVEQVRK